jgi:hypothetical protein
MGRRQERELNSSTLFCGRVMLLSDNKSDNIKTKLRSMKDR